MKIRMEVGVSARKVRLLAGVESQYEDVSLMTEVVGGEKSVLELWGREDWIAFRRFWFTAAGEETSSGPPVLFGCF